MTKDELDAMNKADLEAYEAEQAYLDSLPVAKGYCWMCEGYKCRCEEFGLLD